MIKGLGWKPDKPDFRDKKYKAIKPKYKASHFPDQISLKDKMPPIIDQYELGSCTACSISSALMFNRNITNETPKFRPSRLFIYYNERLLEGTINADPGAEIRTGIKTVNKFGFCDESLWPYIENKYKRRPPTSAYKNASLYKTVEYYRLDNSKIDELKTCLVSGFPFVFGYATFKSGDVADTNGGKIPMPSTIDSDTGGHAVVCCGYNDLDKTFIIHNSWGTECGDKGYYYLPYEYMTTTDLCDDFWTIRKIKETDNK